MSGYHNVRLPETFSRGSLFGPGYNTKVFELDTLREESSSRVPDSGRRNYDLSRGIASISDLYALYRFFIARRGRAFSFRLKDWLDYSTTESGNTHDGSTATATDEAMQQITGSSTSFQLVKRYTSGPTTVVRTIEKPVESTVVVAVSGTPVTTGWWLDPETGRVNFSSVPAMVPTWGGSFDVKARFDAQSDQAFQVAIEAMDAGDIPRIGCVEQMPDEAASQEIPTLGSKNWGAITTSVNLRDVHGKVQVFEPAIGGLRLRLPDPDHYMLGGPIFVLVNAGGQSLALYDHQQNGLVALSTGSVTEVYLAETSAGGRDWVWVVQ